MTPAPQRTLVIRLSSVGDIILSSLLLRVFHRRFPESRIDFLVKERYAGLVRHNPNISRVIAFPERPGSGDLHELRASLSDTRYDLVLDIHDSLRSRYLCLGMKNVRRINKRKLARWVLVRTKWDVYSWFGGAPGVAERYLETVHDLGIADDNGGLEVYVPAEVKLHIDTILEEAGIRKGESSIGVCPSARHSNKIWLKERFAEAATILASENGWPVVLFGSGESERERNNDIATMIAHKSPDARVVNLADRISLIETAAAMERCSLVISNDSGLMHLAAACKRPVAAVFGPTVREFGFFPHGTRSTVIENAGLSCRPCTHIGLDHCPKGHFRCMKDIPSEAVVKAARLLLRA
jgi:heptosyltransferase-2